MIIRLYKYLLRKRQWRALRLQVVFPEPVAAINLLYGPVFSKLRAAVRVFEIHGPYVSMHSQQIKHPDSVKSGLYSLSSLAFTQGSMCLRSSRCGIHGCTLNCVLQEKNTILLKSRAKSIQVDLNIATVATTRCVCNPWQQGR